MAKFMFEFDSEEKTLSVKRDGTELENVSHIVFYKSYMEDGKFSVEVCTQSINEKDKTVERYIINANEFEKISFSNDIAAAVAEHYGV